MNKILTIAASVLALASCASNPYEAINVIPKPVEVEVKCSKFTLDSKTVLVASSKEELATAAYFNGKILSSCGYALATSNVSD